MLRRSARRKAGLAVRIVGGCVASWLLGCAVVAGGLAVVDGRFASGGTADALYAVLAVVALVVWWGGSAPVVRSALRWRRRDREPGTDLSATSADR